MKTTKRLLTVLMTSMVAMLLFSALASAASVEIMTKDGVGSYLTDDKGMTLYLFKKDSPGISACAGPCLEKWPLFTAENLTLPEGVKADDFAVITRADGKKQSTYKGLPLYYFFKDLKAGDTAGQGFNNVWYVVTP